MTFHIAEALSMTGDLRLVTASPLSVSVSPLQLFCGESELVDNIVFVTGSLSVVLASARFSSSHSVVNIGVNKHSFPFSSL